YLPSATVNYAARELQSGLNRAKLMAVTTRQPVCVQPTASGYRFFQNTTCTGTPWSGAGTDANGVFSLANNITVALAAGSNPIFNQFGVASDARAVDRAATHPPVARRVRQHRIHNPCGGGAQTRPGGARAQAGRWKPRRPHARGGLRSAGPPQPPHEELTPEQADFRF